MSNYPIHVAFPGRLIFVGFGSIGQGVLPLILRHVGIKADQITVVTADESGQKVAAEYGVRFIKHALTRENFRHVLDPLVGRGDFLLNLSVDVSSVALIQFCWEKGALYLDTCIEPWPGGYTDPTVPPAKRSNYAMRETALALRETMTRAPDRGAHARRQSRAWCRTSSSRRCSTSPPTAASSTATRPRAMTGRSSRRRSASR